MRPIQSLAHPALVHVVTATLFCGQIHGFQATGGPTFPLAASANGRYLVDARGEPFFYVADTPWFLFMRLTKAEAESYLDHRARQGFSAVQVMLLAEGARPEDRTREGELPLLTPDDLAAPNEKSISLMSSG